jgi:hypothetical protein
MNILIVILTQIVTIPDFTYNKHVLFVYYVSKYFIPFFHDFHIHGFCNRVRIYRTCIDVDDDDDVCGGGLGYLHHSPVSCKR